MSTIPGGKLPGAKNAHLGETYMSDDDRIYPSGLTVREAEEVHKHIIDGTRVFAVISIIAHLLAYAFSPWGG